MLAKNSSAILLAGLLVVLISASTADARQAEAEAEGAASFAAVAEDLRRDAGKAFAQERWDDAVAAYGVFVSHLLEGGYAEESPLVAASRFRIAMAFKNSGDYPAAQTILLYLEESAPEYEAASRRLLLARVRAALGLAPPPAKSPPVAEPRFEHPVRVGGDVTRPELLSRVDPEYTWEARRARIQGVVIVEVVIDTAGRVTDVKVLKPLPMGLDRAAVAAVKRWTFRPAMYQGKPVAVHYNLTVNFRLQ